MKKPMHKFWIGEEVYEEIGYLLRCRPVHTVRDLKWVSHIDGWQHLDGWQYLIYPNYWIRESRLEAKPPPDRERGRDHEQGAD